MREILEKLNKTQGVRGSVLVSRDGIVIASDYADTVDEKSTGAISSAILAALEGALKRINFGEFKRALLTGSDCKMELVAAGPSLLLVLLNRDTNLGMVNLEIKEAVAAIAAESKM